MGNCCVAHRTAITESRQNSMRGSFDIDAPPPCIYELNVQCPSEYSSNLEEKVERRARNNPQKLFKLNRVHACFKHQEENADSEISSDSSDKKSATTMPTDLTTSDRFSKWRIQ